MVSGRPERWCRNRLFEWVMAMALLGLGVHLAIFPSSVRASSFRFILDYWYTSSIMSIYLAVGIARVAALVANGRWPVIGPHVRAVASLLAAAIWLQMLIALVILIPEVGSSPSPGIPVYTALFLGELVSTHRAARDAVRRGHR